jgi:hypothetical protein
VQGQDHAEEVSRERSPRAAEAADASLAADAQGQVAAEAQPFKPFPFALQPPPPQTSVQGLPAMGFVASVPMHPGEPPTASHCRQSDAALFADRLTETQAAAKPVQSTRHLPLPHSTPIIWQA